MSNHVVLVRMRPAAAFVKLPPAFLIGILGIVVSLSGYAPFGFVGTAVGLTSSVLFIAFAVWILASNLIKRFAVLRFGSGQLELVYPLGMGRFARGPTRLDVESRSLVKIEATERTPDRKLVDFTVHHGDRSVQFEVGRSVLDDDWQARVKDWQESSEPS